LKNVENGVIWGGLGSPKVTDNSAIRQTAYDFLLAFHSSYLALFLSYTEIFVENRRFEPTPPPFGFHVGVISLELHGHFSIRKLECLGYRMVLLVWFYVQPPLYNSDLW